MNRAENGNNHIKELFKKIKEEKMQAPDMRLLADERFNCFELLDQHVLETQGAAYFLNVLRDKEEDIAPAGRAALVVAGLVWRALSEEQRSVILQGVNGDKRVPGEDVAGSQEIKRRLAVFIDVFD